MKSIRLLLVDDNVLIRNAMKNIISCIPNINVIGECLDGNEVVPFILLNHVDVIFMDINMKFMDGFEATIAVKEHNMNTKVIGLSSQDDILSMQRMKECGADGFISKFEVNKELIISELRKVMECSL